MKYEITSIELSHDDAMKVHDDFVEKIDELYMKDAEQLERAKGHEFEIWTDDEQVAMYLNVEFFTSYGYPKGFDDISIESRSVKTKLTMFNAYGTEITWKVKGERIHENGKWYTRPVVDIEEKIKEYCAI